jgi:DNA repair protein RecN (Recombination protein N)
LKSAAIGVDEASYAIRDYLDRLEADPDRLENIESRLAMIDKLKRKYGSSLAEVLAFLDNVRGQIQAVETAGERKSKLEQDLARSSEAYREAAASLTKQRKSAAEKLARKVEGELGSLAMENAVSD